MFFVKHNFTYNKMTYSFYKTGRISVYDNIREKQGLGTQSIANLSLDCSNCNCCYDDKCFYPFYSVKLNYNCKLNPNDCSKCTRYVQPA